MARFNEQGCLHVVFDIHYSGDREVVWVHRVIDGRGRTRTERWGDGDGKDRTGRSKGWLSWIANGGRLAGTAGSGKVICSCKEEQTHVLVNEGDIWYVTAGDSRTVSKWTSDDGSQNVLSLVIE
jgi:hypothetical protein